MDPFKQPNVNLSGDTGIHLESGDVAFKTGGTTRMTLKSGGNIGIGTDNPQQKLDIRGDFSMIALGDADTGLKQQGDGELAIITDNNEKMRIDKTGRVGIGETIPFAGLVIRHGLNGVKVFAMETSNENDGNLGGYMDFRWEGADANYNMAVYMKNGNSPFNHHKIGYFENDNENTNHVFFTGQHRNILNQNITENTKK